MSTLVAGNLAGSAAAPAGAAAATSGFAPYIQAGGALLSGLSGFFGNSGPSTRKQAAFLQQQHELNAYGEGLRIDTLMRKAKEYGVHKLSMLGINPSSGGVSPITFGSDTPASALDGMGQGISRAADAWNLKEARAMEAESARLTLQNQHLQNVRLASEIALMRQPGTPPGIALNPATPFGGDVSVLPSEVTSANPYNVGSEAGTKPGSTIYTSFSGRPVMLPSEQRAESMESIPWPASMGVALDYIVNDWVPWQYDRARDAVKGKVSRYLSDLGYR